MNTKAANICVILWFCFFAPISAAELIPRDQFDKIHTLIKPQNDESQWLRIPWLTSIWEARQKAAAEGKPILLWSGGGAAPIGGC